MPHIYDAVGLVYTLGLIILESLYVSGDWNVWGLCCLWHLECWLHCDRASYLCTSLLWSPAYASSLPYCPGFLYILFFVDVVLIYLLEWGSFGVPFRLFCFVYLLLFFVSFGWTASSVFHFDFPGEWTSFRMLRNTLFSIWRTINLVGLFQKKFSRFFIIVILLWLPNINSHGDFFPSFFYSFRMSILQYRIAYLQTLLIFCVSALRRWGGRNINCWLIVLMFPLWLTLSFGLALSSYKIFGS